MNGKSKSLAQNARNLRNRMTEEERHLWYDFLKNCRRRFTGKR